MMRILNWEFNNHGDPSLKMDDMARLHINILKMTPSDRSPSRMKPMAMEVP